MDHQNLKELLLRFQTGETKVEEVIAKLKDLPYENLGYANVDHHRAIRQGFPEVIFGHGKTPEQIAGIAERLLARASNILVTRTNLQAFELVQKINPDRKSTRLNSSHG